MLNETRQIIDVVRQCGDLMRNADRTNLGIDAKEGPANFVTQYDKMVELKLRKELLTIVPEAIFIGEEGEQVAFSDKGKYFIVDPIDGTTNFIKDYHASAISVALMENGQPAIAVIYNPYLDEMFRAERGNGAFCGDQPIHVSCQPMENGVILFGTSPYYEDLSKRSFELAYQYFRQALDIRRSGSAALDLCSIAAGRAELYFELRLSPWDYAAGVLLVEEAGGIVTDIDGGPVVYDRPCSILARNR